MSRTLTRAKRGDLQGDRFEAAATYSSVMQRLRPIAQKNGWTLANCIADAIEQWIATIPVEKRPGPDLELETR